MNDGLDKGLEFRGCLPFSVESISSIPEVGVLLGINHGNEQVLRSIMMLEDKLDGDDDDPVVLELRRQDQKINLVLELLSNLMMQFNSVPAPKEIYLTDSMLSFPEETASISGLCEVQVNIEPTIPRPLRLFGTADYDELNKRTVVTFMGLSQGLIDNLDKFIFRFHRRLVASLKSK